jgi:hypothetical protein
MFINYFILYIWDMLFNFMSPLLQTLLDASRWVSDMKDMENVVKEEVSFLGEGFLTALKDQIHTDIELKPGNNGPSIPAHRALLVSLSFSLLDFFFPFLLFFLC